MSNTRTIADRSAWRFLKLALKLRAPKPAFGYVLITLADHADPDGVAYPGYETLMKATAYTSKQTITEALKYWHSLGVLTWKKGWGNIHKSRPNIYQFHEDVMRTLYTQQKSDSRNLSEGSLEISVRPDEISLSQSRNLSEGSMKSHTVVAKVLAKNVPVNITSQLHNAGAALHSETKNRRQESVQHSPMKESSPHEISSESSPREISSGRSHQDRLDAIASKAEANQR